MRLSNDQHDTKGNLINGFDYDLQVWVADGVIQRCGHPDSMDCQCLAKIHAGKKLAEVA